MNISFAFKNFEASEHLKKYARRRMEKLGRFFGKASGLEVAVVLTVDKFRHRCEVTVTGEGLHINATEQTSDMYAAIDLVTDKVESQIKRQVARVKAHMSRYERLIGSGMPANDIIEIRGLKIDKTARRVYVNGEEKNFTTKEFDLLTFLAQNPNHVFTKEELFSKIWDMESIGDIATVTVHIKKIREKIEMNTAKPQYIETIWGVGYRFKV